MVESVEAWGIGGGLMRGGGDVVMILAFSRDIWIV